MVMLALLILIPSVLYWRLILDRLTRLVVILSGCGSASMCLMSILSLLKICCIIKSIDFCVGGESDYNAKYIICFMLMMT